MLFVWFGVGIICGWLAVVGGLLDFLLWRLVMALP